MPDDATRIRSDYPLPAYNYRVSIAIDGKLASVGFSEVSGLTVAAEPVVYAHGMSFVMGRRIVPGRPEPVRITLRRGIVPRTSRPLLAWFNGTYHDPLFPDAQRNVIIDLCDAAGDPLVRWTAANALPVRLEGPALNATGNDVAIETLELIADRLQITYDP